LQDSSFRWAHPRAPVEKESRGSMTNKEKTCHSFIIILLAIQCTFSFTPSVFRDKEFTCASLAEAVNYYINIGEDSAIFELKRLTYDNKPITDQNYFSISGRIGWMCRILFQSKTNEPLRPPGLGALHLPYNTMPLKNWPLYPLEQSGNSFFILSEGYLLSGLPENISKYIDYCRQNGTFRKTKVTIPTQEEAKKDATALRNSHAWRSIKWKDSGQGWSYSIPESWVWDFILKQTDYNAKFNAKRIKCGN
jgi:hypothetical protein